jgi:putative toxin-antitoxin system antitoxin component (TIGR02293 family)
MVRSVWDTIGIAKDQWIDAVNQGLPIGHLRDFFLETELPPEPVFKVLKLTRQEYQSREHLSPEESERLWRLASVYERSLALFEGDAHRTTQWLNTPQQGIGRVSPLEHIVTEPGAAEVRDLIGRLEYGVIS